MKFISNLNPREKRLFFFALTVGSLTLAYIYLLEPLWLYWTNLDKTISDYKKQLQQDQIILSREKSITEEYKIFESKLKIDADDQKKTAEILKEIENSARTNGVNINDIKPQQVKDEDFYKFYVIDLEAEADVMALAKFIYDLQISQQVLRVSRIQLTANANKPEFLKVEMLITKILLQ